MRKTRKKKMSSQKKLVPLSLFNFKSHPCRLAVQKRQPGGLPGDVELQEEAQERRCSQEAGAAPTWMDGFPRRLSSLLPFSLVRKELLSLFSRKLAAARVERNRSLFQPERETGRDERGRGRSVGALAINASCKSSKERKSEEVRKFSLSFFFPRRRERWGGDGSCKKKAFRVGTRRRPSADLQFISPVHHDAGASAHRRGCRNRRCCRCSPAPADNYEGRRRHQFSSVPPRAPGYSDGPHSPSPSASGVRHR